MSRFIELLAPARNLTCGIEAIRHGADAVYIGADRFGARAAAGNSIEDIRELCRFAHQYRARIYVTVNTILYEDELEATRRLVFQLYEAGVDALIVQDLALLAMDLPPIPLHASTQMDNRTPEQALWLREMGFGQMVLARELSLEQIRDIHAALRRQSQADGKPEPLIEAFVHGALCVSYSGRCYASQHCFGRSANRGECAQFCRLAFDLEDDRGQVLERQRHLLSLRDMNRAEHLEAMIDAGVSSFKIEGRLKDVAYIKNVTAYYRQRLDDILSRRTDLGRPSLGRSTYTFTPNPAKSFNRGFTDYFLYGRRGDESNPVTPKAMGEAVGRVADVRTAPPVVTVDTDVAFHNGDGFCYVDASDTLQGFRVDRAEGNRLYGAAPGLSRGMMLYRNQDTAFERLLARPSAERRIPVCWHLCDTSSGFALTLSVAGDVACAASDTAVTLTFAHPHEPSRSPQEEPVRRQLSRMGDTIFEVADIRVALSQPWFIPSAVLGEWRREVSAALLQRLEAVSRPASVTATVSPTGSVPEHVAWKGRPLGYGANVSNSLSQAVCRRAGAVSVAPAFELQEPAEATLMTCRYCIRHAVGRCPRQSRPASAAPPSSGSPLFLRLSDGRRFPLRFDCSRCEMSVCTEQAEPRAAREEGRKKKGGHHMAFILLLLLMLTSCYSKPVFLSQEPDGLPGTALDSINFTHSHHYTVGYNFMLQTDSLPILEERPLHTSEGAVLSSDTFWLCRHDMMVVAAITVIPEDSIDSVWVKVARDQTTMGWVHESELLDASTPADPISRFISLFSTKHLWWFGPVIGVALLVLLFLAIRRLRYRFLFHHDIPSSYPTLLTVTVAVATVLYAFIQRYAPDLWLHFYFHPTLNPLVQPPLMCALLCVLWLMILLTVAALQNIFRLQPFADALFYLLFLMGACMFIYIFFSLLPPSPLSCILCLGYACLSVGHYWLHARARYFCGQCGMKLQEKGTCPRCGAFNE